mmetsp:Transcript_90480/g.255411  ORF Transcript_90480/g.255411 Transcript_90480/m.255411 type:complete len:261 (+) Transcript_90480:1030-1812(+)
MFKESREVSGVAQASACFAEFIEGQLPTLILVQAKPPSADYGAILADAELLEFFRSVDEPIWNVGLEASPPVVLPPRDGQTSSNRVKVVRIATLLKRHVQRRLAISLESVRICKHAKVSAAQAGVRLRIEVPQGESCSASLRSHPSEELLGVAREAEAFARFSEIVLADTTDALDVEGLHPRLEHAPVLFLGERAQLGQRGIGVGMDIGQDQEALRLSSKLVPKRLHVSMYAEPVEREAELSERQTLVAVKVQGFLPRTD